MTIFKKESGLIFKDDFLEGVLHSRWTPSPPSFVEIGDGKLIVKHTLNDTKVLFDLPDESQALLEVVAEYKPDVSGDEGGIVIWRESCHQLEFLESYSDDSEDVGDYSKWRAYKKGDEWSFYADRGFGWEINDTASLTATKAGIVLKNNQKQGFKDMIVRSVVLCKDKKITVLGLDESYTVYLCNEEGYMIEGSYVESGEVGVQVSIPTAHYFGIINVFDKNNRLISSIGPIDIYGGDVYCLGSSVKVLRGGQELDTLQITDIGTLYNGLLEERWELYNPNNAPITNVRLRLAKYQDNFGFDWVSVSADEDEKVYSKDLFVDEVKANEKVGFWVRIEKKELDKLTLDKGMVYIDISHD